MDLVDETEVKHFHRAKTMLLPAMLLEFAYLISSRNSAQQLKLQGAEMSYLVVIEYCVKMAYYSTMAHLNGGIVHVNLRAFGPTRACYTNRFIGWSIAVPTLNALSNYPLLGKAPISAFVHRLIPSMFATLGYILASWLAEVCPDPAAGWGLIALAFVSYIVVVWDQVVLVVEAAPELRGRSFKLVVVVLKEVVFFVYGVVCLFGVADVLSSLSEQVFYTYADVMLKVLQASAMVIVRNWEDLAELQHAMLMQVETGKEDRRRLFHFANAPIFAITEDGSVVAWNEHIEKATGLREESAVGRSILDLVDPGSRESLQAAVASCWSGAGSGVLEVTMRRQPERPPVQMLLSLIEQLGSDPIKTITAIGQDLTEVSAMKAMNDRKARFTAVLGHELRSPLHGIMGLSGSLAEGTPNPMQKRQCSMIKGCAERLLDLVTNIMEMARAERIAEPGGQLLDRRPFNIMDIVGEVIDMTQTAVDKNGRHLVSSNVTMTNGVCTGRLPMVVGDAYKITQLLYNLVTNAAKFTVAGSILISAREDEAKLGGFSRAKGMLELDVADTGKGIEPEAMERIFEPFQQTENKDAQSFQGIGLGLSVAMGIARLHGGEIRVTSRRGQGSTFTVALPCDFSRRAGLTHHLHDAGGAVDDDDINQEVIEQTLGSEFRIVRATNCMEAFAYLDSGKEFPTLMLLDVMMPSLTGFEVVKEIRDKRNLSHAQLPVVMLSARSPQEATANEAFESGATDYMQKPFSTAVLKQRLNVILAVRQEIHKAEVGAVENFKREAEAMQPKDEQKERKQDGQREGEEREQRAAALAEAIGKLEQECGELKERLQAKQHDTSEAQVELQRLLSERDRLTAELAAAAVVAVAPPKMVRAFDSGAAAWAAAEFYRAEVGLRERQVCELRQALDRHKGEAYLQRGRAEAIDRELRFVRQLRCRLGDIARA